MSRVGYLLAVLGCAGALVAPTLYADTRSGAPATSFAAVDAALAGPFDIRVTVVRSNIQRPGSTHKRIWRFEPLCDSGVCERVRLHRRLPGGHGSAASLLRRTDTGRYRGTELQRVSCPDGELGRQVSKTRFRIARSRDGEAGKIAGRGELRVRGCPGNLHADAEFIGHSRR